MPVTSPPDLTATLNKVFAVTLVFWIIKIRATTVGETAADVLSTTFHLGLVVTSLVMAVLLVVAVSPLDIPITTSRAVSPAVK